MPNSKFDRLLDIGYGSGIFFLELAKYAEHLYGVDIHQDGDRVKGAIKKYHIDVELKTGNVLELPYDDEQFDAIVCISVIEHIKNLERAINEIKRICTKEGVMFFGFPVRNRFTSSFYTSVGFDHKTHHPSDHRTILEKLNKQTKILRQITYPALLPLDFNLYVSCSCSK
jgi:ubiquinone/menaquinone biosynthesis C-methylase UbiE